MHTVVITLGVLRLFSNLLPNFVSLVAHAIIVVRRRLLTIVILSNYTTFLVVVWIKVILLIIRAIVLIVMIVVRSCIVSFGPLVAGLVVLRLFVLVSSASLFLFIVL